LADFSIEIVPPFPPAAEHGPSPFQGEVAALWQGPLARHGELHQIIYRVGGEMFAYYPANIIVVLEDLQAEAQAFAAGRSHYVEVAGYAVAYAHCKNDHVWFCEPPQIFGTEDDQPLIGPGVPLQTVRRTLSRAVADVQNHVGALLA
jgi:hypothetical protein